jgi:CMP-N,N'-diacetyllegionaminic acid synthase
MKFKNEFWAFIPARSGSKSIKNKNITSLGKKPLIAYSLVAAKNSKNIAKIVFSSDSIKYFNIAKKYANFFFHKRNKKISSDYSTDYDVFRDFVKNYKGFLPKFFIHLRPTTPLRNSKLIDKIISIFKKNEKRFSALRSVSAMTNSPYKTVVIKRNKIFSPFYKSFNMDKINFPRQRHSKVYLPDGYIDIIKTESILNGFLHGNRVMPYISKDFIVDIDNSFDLKIANYLIKNMKNNI